MRQGSEVSRKARWTKNSRQREMYVAFPYIDRPPTTFRTERCQRIIVATSSLCKLRASNEVNGMNWNNTVVGNGPFLKPFYRLYSLASLQVLEHRFPKSGMYGDGRMHWRENQDEDIYCLRWHNSIVHSLGRIVRRYPGLPDLG